MQKAIEAENSEHQAQQDAGDERDGFH